MPAKLGGRKNYPVQQFALVESKASGHVDVRRHWNTVHAKMIALEANLQLVYMPMRLLCKANGHSHLTSVAINQWKEHIWLDYIMHMLGMKLLGSISNICFTMIASWRCRRHNLWCGPLHTLAMNRHSLHSIPAGLKRQVRRSPYRASAWASFKHRLIATIATIAKAAWLSHL